MNSLINNLIQDPVVFSELLTASLSGLYLLRLNLLRDKSPNNQIVLNNYRAGECLNKTQFTYARNDQTKLRQQIFKAFSVGVWISTSKKSLRKQFLYPSRYRFTD